MMTKMSTVVSLLIAIGVLSGVKSAAIPSITTEMLKDKVKELINIHDSLLVNLKTERFGNPNYFTRYTNRKVPQEEDAYERSRDLEFPEIFAAYYDELFMYTKAMECFKGYELSMTVTPDHVNDLNTIITKIDEVRATIGNYLTEEGKQSMIGESGGMYLACRNYPNDRTKNFMMVATMENFKDYLNVMENDALGLYNRDRTN